MNPPAPVTPRIRLITPVWGASYIDRWLRLSAAALRGDGNLGYLNEHSVLELAMVTRAVDVAGFRADPRFVAMTAGIRVTFITLDDFLPADGGVHYGVPLTLAYAKAIHDLGPAGLGTYAILLNADFVLAAGALQGLLGRIREGYACLAAPSLRVIDGPAGAALQALVDPATGVLSVGPRPLMKIVNAHLHATIAGRIVNDLGPVDSTYYNQIYWRVSDTCLALRAFLTMPLCVRVDRIPERVVSPVDYGVLSDVCPEGRFGVLTDSDELLMLELQARDSEAQLLRLAPETTSLPRKLARLTGEIAAQAASWTTADHRRAATHTALFHEDDLPAHVTGDLAAFERFVDGVLARLPAPVPCARHPHWLPAVQQYRKELARCGMEPVTLLDDPRNAVS